MIPSHTSLTVAELERLLSPRLLLCPMPVDELMGGLGTLVFYEPGPLAPARWLRPEDIN